MSSYDEVEKEAFAHESAKNVPASGRISIRVQCGLNYAIGCEIEQHGTIDAHELMGGLAHAVGCMLQNVYFNTIEMGWIKDDPVIKAHIAKQILESAGRKFMSDDPQDGYTTGVVDAKDSGRA